MNIGIDARPLSYHLTGIGYYLQNILDALQVIDQENNYYLVSNKTVNYQINNDKWSKIEGHAGGKPISSIWMQTCVPGLARKYKFDIFWGTRHHLPLFLSRRVKRVVTIHDLVHLRYPETMQPKNLILERILMKRSLSAADAIISVSHATATDIKKCYAKIQENHIHTIYSGVPQLYEAHDCSRIIVQLPQKYFLFVGTLEPRKNIHNILRAFERLNPEKYDIYLVIVGEKGWKDKELKKYLVDYNFESRIVFTGYVSRDMMINLYKKSVCLIFPSLYEGFGFPILEAMSCGTPVITSNTSSMKEIAADAALLGNPYDDAEIARAMRLILIDTDLRKRLIGKAALRLKHFSWERCAHKLMEIFYKVTNN
jgi:glycosyltransferase involved in cell wall biosynthesis